MKKCQKCRKSSYPNQKTARRVMMRIISHDPSTDMFDLHTYKCPYHNDPKTEKWHVGHYSYFLKALEKTNDTKIRTDNDDRRNTSIGARSSTG